MVNSPLETMKEWNNCQHPLHFSTLLYLSTGSPVLYEIVGGSEIWRFKAESRSGRLLLTKPLDHEHRTTVTVHNGSLYRTRGFDILCWYFGCRYHCFITIILRKELEPFILMLYFTKQKLIMNFLLGLLKKNTYFFCIKSMFNIICITFYYFYHRLCCQLMVLHAKIFYYLTQTVEKTRISSAFYLTKKSIYEHRLMVFQKRHNSANQTCSHVSKAFIRNF